MPHAKFQDHRTSGSGEECFFFFVFFFIYGHGGHIGHGTWTIFMNFLFPFPRRLHMKFGIDKPSGSKEEEL